MSPLLFLLLSSSLAGASAFAPPLPNSLSYPSVSSSPWKNRQAPSCLYSTPDDEQVNEEGMDLAAQFAKLAQERNIALDENDLFDDEEEDSIENDLDDLDAKIEINPEGTVSADVEFYGEDDEDDDDDDDEEVNIPQGAINAFLGYDTGDVGEKLAGNVSLTNDQIYGEMKERVLDTAGGFVELVGSDKDGDEIREEEKPKPYVPPTTVPDSDLTAGEVVLLVLDALLHNDVPTKNRGVEILFGYSSEGSQIKNEVGLTPQEYTDFLKETEYKVLFNHQDVSIDKGDYSFDGKKAFFTARLKNGPKPLDVVSVNFILSTKGNDEDDVWLIDSMLIRPSSMRRRRRR
eukprot:CAMPEP_0202509750 /NCGR_PEP_ID=MMETSP1361-20130828/52935_1 /ASSEMBLY_ACC=CAM_ASM_000849 /TAXON_ID=210615 /ORGANISM="Staurosira complex sp., Strain CCMP2646" /LENGTH=345 /DNA_ID=CAMNT_0049143985 /DNA_START=81 /DNA_END=1118 /DNA_ORIENTATION=+